MRLGENAAPEEQQQLNLRAMDCALRCLQALPASPSASYVMLHTLHYIKRCAPASLDLCVAVAAEGEDRRGGERHYLASLKDCQEATPAGLLSLSFWAFSLSHLSPPSHFPRRGGKRALVTE